MTAPFESPLSPASDEPLPDHLIRLPGANGGWALWRTACLRGTGFPADQVLRIADPACAEAADRLNGMLGEAEALREAALEALRGELAAAGKDRLDLLVKAIRRVKRGQAPHAGALAELAGGTAAAIAAWQAAAGRAAEERERFAATYAAGEERVDEVLREVAQDERFREALVWQNRHAAETGLKSFLRRDRRDSRGTARDRGHGQMLALYLQRYCAKNDTIGFFGPVGWARLGEISERIAVEPGPELLADRQVFFEDWTVDALAARIAQEEAMRPWLYPRRSPFVRRGEGYRWLLPDGQSFELGPLSSALFAACDGTRSARELLRALGPDVTPDKAAILWKMLSDFHAQGLVRWGFQIPLSSHPERFLREQLEKIEEAPLREAALAALDELERGRQAVARAAGNADELDRALGELEASFTRLTGRGASQMGGRLYAGRTLVYEDCLRDLDLQLGAPFVAEVAPALSMVLDSARWYTHYMAEGMRELFREVYAELSSQAPASGELDLLHFARLALPRLVHPETHHSRQEELYARWARILSVPPGQRRVHHRSEDLLPLAREEFAAPGPGWKKARYHCPDVLIAAESVEAIQRGDYQVVVGETHLAINSLDRNLFFSQHPDAEQLSAAIDSDLPDPSIILLFAKRFNEESATSNLGLWAPTANGRMNYGLLSDKDFYLDISLDAHTAPPERVLAVSDLVIEPADGGTFVVRPREGGAGFDVVDFFQFVLMMQVLDTFSVMPAGDYTPRVTIDRLVVTRESWRFPASSLDFVQLPTAAERFAGARRWAAEIGLPRFLFSKALGEMKPVYLDLESPALVEIFAKAVRKATALSEEATVRVTEMLPAHGQTWLPDAEGNRYSCELRMVALDLA
ncbi:MAG TPA: lantibiotic dehydratase [Thermoanaerobaculia bacterium]|nr:lantibiotic dehydratase [Thermoanaerobaculia bacterium]